MKEKKPHVQFTMSMQPISAALADLEVISAESSTPSPTWSSWPRSDAWEPYLSARRLQLRRLLPEADEAAISSQLESLENDYNDWLAARASGPGEGEKLHQLAARAAALEPLICATGSPASFPFFARYFLLDCALFGELMQLSEVSSADQLAKVKLWWRCRAYLQAVFQNAYAERVGQIILRYTGATKNRVFVEDAATHEALTIDVIASGQDENELRRVQSYLASKAAWQYIQDLRIEEGARILAHAHATIVVTADSRIQQNELVDPAKFWEEQRQSIEEEIEVRRAECGPLLDLLVLGKPAVAATLQPVEIGVKAPPEYWGYLETVIPGLISMVPVVGSGAAVVWSVYLKLIGGLLYPDAPDPLIEFEKKMEALIYDKIAEADAKWINNMLKGIEDELKSLLDACKKNNQALHQDFALKTRAIALFSTVLSNKHHLLDPASGSYYKVAPYYWRYFICYLTAADLAREAGDSRDFLSLRKTLYQDTNRLVSNGIHGMATERISRIRIMNTSNGCKEDIKEVYDYRVSKKFSSDLRNYSKDYHHYATVACGEAAGMATAIQHMREMSQALDALIVGDTAVVNNSSSGFRPSTIADTYHNAMGYRQGQVWSGYQLLINKGIQGLVHADVGRFNSASKAQLSLPETQFPGANVFQL